MLNRQHGSILLESLIAAAIFSFGILALMGMQAASIRQSSEARYRNEAALLASQIISQIQVDQTNLAAYGGGSDAGAAPKNTWMEQIRQTLPNGGGSIQIIDTVASPRTVNVTITWQSPGETQSHRYLASSRIMPACYDPATQSTAC